MTHKSFKQWLSEEVITEETLTEGKLTKFVDIFMNKFVRMQEIFPSQIGTPQKFEKFIDKNFNNWKEHLKKNPTSKNKNYFAWFGNAFQQIFNLGFQKAKMGNAYEWYKEIGFSNEATDDATRYTFYKEFMQAYEKKHHVNLHSNWEKEI